MKRILDYIEKYHMLKKGDRVIAGVSGGADSVCLLFVLLELKKSLGIELIAVHVNHGLRGETARRDELFTKELCERYGVPCEICHENVELTARKRKQSIEEAGRQVRREAFERVRKTYGGTKIALAHHQNDNAETMLMNLSRGSGVRGLGGIRPVNGCMIRPLLCINRQEIEQILKSNGFRYCEDETNMQDIYTRNRIRHQVIPTLEKCVNRQAVRHMNETMEQLQEVEDYLQEQTKAAYECYVSKKEDGRLGLRISERLIRECHPVIQKMVIRTSLEQAAGHAENLSAVHVKTVRMLFENQTGRSRNLPYGLRAVRGYEEICLEAADDTEPKAALGEVPIQIPGKTLFPDKNLIICCTILEKSRDFSVEEIPQKAYTKWFDYDIIKNSLTVRGRQTEDTIKIDRAGHSQKLKAYYINEKIPAQMRSGIPLIADGNEIVWIVGFRMSAGYQVSEETKRILQIQITEDKKDGRND